MTEDDVAQIIGDRLGERIAARRFPPFTVETQRSVDFRLDGVTEADINEAVGYLLSKWAPLKPSAYRLMTLVTLDGDAITRLDTWNNPRA